MNKGLTTDMSDANELQRAINQIFQHQENGHRVLQCTMHNGQYRVFKQSCKLITLFTYYPGQ